MSLDLEMRDVPAEPNGDVRVPSSVADCTLKSEDLDRSVLVAERHVRAASDGPELGRLSPHVFPEWRQKGTRTGQIPQPNNEVIQGPQQRAHKAAHSLMFRVPICM